MKYIFYGISIFYLLSCSNTLKPNNIHNMQEKNKQENPHYSRTEKKIVHLPNTVWKRMLSPELYKVAREAGTEMPFSGIKKYADKNLILLSENLKTDKKTQEKTDKIVKSTVYKYILRNTKKFSVLISKTVGNWQGKELSEKLELEVGKDLQFIRINGTLVGGLVGLLLYTISYFLL
jgi:uncharacterized membrane-anchored protein YjiN (DUF445 family)